MNKENQDKVTEQHHNKTVERFTPLLCPKIQETEIWIKATGITLTQ